ncbi:MAG: MerR family DNA-binding protein [Proteobacteria bacterium]|nr:MerR family DNA-binding protein [Pseudomonadota bacterium]
MSGSVTWVARAAGVKTSTVRYYERADLIDPPRATNGYRVYVVDDVRRLRFIRRAQELGFSLDEIRVALRASDRGVIDDDAMRELVRRKIADLDARIGDLTRVRAGLQTLSRRRRRQASCPLLDALGDC